MNECCLVCSGPKKRNEISRMQECLSLTDDEVGDGEGEEEVVGYGLQLLVHLEADHHLLRRGSKS